MSNLKVELNANQISTNINSPVKLLVFEVGKLTLALPILQVQKVVKYSELHGSGLSYVNLTHLEQQEIAVVDLHQKLFNISLSKAFPEDNHLGYFIISKIIAGEHLGIMVNNPPSLIDVDPEKIRLIPDSYRRADTLEIASHVTVIPQENQTSVIIFILDLEQLIL